MDDLNSSQATDGDKQVMLLGKSTTFDDNCLENVASATRLPVAQSYHGAEFIEKLKTGDADAFDTLVNRYSGDIYALLFRVVGNAEEAGDLTQETFLRALRSIGKFRGDAELKTWLFRIAINESRNRYRWWKRRKRESTISLDDPVGNTEFAVFETIASPSPDPEAETLRREREALLEVALVQLPDIYREVVVLSDIEGFSYEEIGRTLDINIGTVKSRIARGREALRKSLKDI
jgi:RNA polymerase sigma-70 factor (ECF subfamily)